MGWSPAQGIFYGEFHNAPHETGTGRPKLCYKDVIKRGMIGFHISPWFWQTLAADCDRRRASPSDGYSSQAINVEAARLAGRAKLKNNSFVFY